MLTVHAAEPLPAGERDVCPMQAIINRNFASQLRSANVSFSEHSGPLSIKCAFGGEELYQLNGGRYAVDDSVYLVLNEGQRYASLIETPERIESFCIWFRPQFAADVLGALRTPADRLLHDPLTASRLPVHFFERVTPHDDIVSPVLREIRSKISEPAGAEREWLEERFHLLLARLLHAHRGVYRDVERLPAVRWSTRLELFRRLERARSYLDASVGTTVTLPEVALVAGLSPHHFLRTFQKAYHVTPRQYLSRRRLERARLLVASTEQPITDICYEVGFESLGSFSSLFRRVYGASPTEFRLQHRGVRPQFACRMQGEPTDSVTAHTL